MRTIFLDTNILLDWLLKRQPFYLASARVLTLADRGEITAYVSALSVANAAYIVERHSKGQTARTTAAAIREIIRVLALKDEHLALAIGDVTFDDFEDCVQYYAATEVGAECVITHDKTGFDNSALPVFTAAEFLALRGSP